MQDIQIQKAEGTDWDKITSIMKTVMEHITDKASFFTDGWEEIFHDVKDNGYAFTAVCDGVTAGFLLVYIPGDNEDNLGKDIDLAEEELMRVAHMEVVAVLPQFRGLGLQKKLIGAAEAVLSEEGYRYGMATVYPKNSYSLNNFTALGYRIVKTKKKYGGLDRHILMKELIS